MAALLMATTVFVVPAAADVGGSRDASEDVRVVRVAFPEVEGISETDADGVRSGIADGQKPGPSSRRTNRFAGKL